MIRERREKENKGKKKRMKKKKGNKKQERKEEDDEIKKKEDKDIKMKRNQSPNTMVRDGHRYPCPALLFHNGSCYVSRAAAPEGTRGDKVL